MSAVDWLGRFAEPETEATYRRVSRGDQRQVNILLSLLFVAVSLLMMAIESGSELEQIFLRGIQLAIGGGLVACSILSRTSWQVAACSYVIVITALSTFLWSDVSRPSDYVAHLGLDVFVIMSAYFALPNAVLRLIVPVSFSLLLLVVFLVLKTSVSAYDNQTIVFTLLLTNVMGFLAAGQFQKECRMGWQQLVEERALRERLERTRTEADELARLMPICARCKKVRNDEGYWDHVEDYLLETSGAQVSHGLCPACLEKYASE
ncbi:MAG: hypothetical protein U5O39_06835 [Gammaproteobacteria bacterium]|nr:hypothetical protein [Gammaproteobacteria bacterium]